jgi:beta-lactamase regulating signal transducer with metallopeptidase domain
MIDWLLHTLVATSALVLGVLLLREPVRKRFGSRVAYGLWLIPAARLFMPTLTHTVERSVPATGTSFQLVATESLSMAHVAAPPPSLIDSVGGWTTLLLVLWLGVAAGLFLSRIIAFHRDRRAILKSCSAVTRLGSIHLVRTREISSPVALGILRPIIAVPENFERLYGKQERRLVLEHELAHHRSGDLVANLFAFVLLCLQWFNPLAWVAHAAFRFDQEAACDARVLDKAPPCDRASYGRAIAKAASGRALLFASALDRPTSLQRRLQSMLRSPTPTRRAIGRLLILTVAAAAMPLTASRAVEYVITPAPPTPAVAATRVLPPVAAMGATVSQMAEPQRATAPTHPAATVYDVTASDGQHFAVSDNHDHFNGDLTINEDYVTIDGKKKRWEDLTPAERARAREAVAKARTALANSHFDEAKMMRDLAKVPDKARVAEIQRQLAGTRADLAESVGRMQEEAARARAAGRAPDALEAAIAERLQSVQDVDFEAASRALAGIDSKKIAADIAGAQDSMERAKAELERIQARLDADQRH